MNINPNFKLLSYLWILAFFFPGKLLLAQSDPTGERRVTGTYALTNATVYTSPGKFLEDATVLIKDGLIQAVGKNINIPQGTHEISLDSLFVYPGFIDGSSSAGITRPNDVEKPSDFNPSNPPDEVAGITPWRSALDQFDNKNSQVKEWRKTGITIASIAPDGGMLPGKSAIVIFGGSPNSTNVLAQNTGLYVKFRGSRGMYPGTVLGVMAKFRDLYQNAELSARHERLFASNTGINRPEINKTLASFYPVLDKNLPVFFEVSNELEIRRVLRLQKEHGFKLVLVGVTQAEHVINDIRSANAQVLLSLNLPEDKASKASTEEVKEEVKARINRVVESYQSMLKQAALLEGAGIKFGFASSGVKSEDMLKNIRLMVTNGLSEDAALAALTTHNAQILGIQKFAGTIEKGKLANLVITTAPVFDEDAHVKHVVADGYIFDVETKPKKKNDKGNGGEDGPGSIVGEWEYTSDTPAGSSGGAMNIEKSGDDLKGTITYDDPSGSGKTSSAMKDISYSGGKLRFTFEVSASGMALEVTVEGDVSCDEFSGNMSLEEYGSFPLNASKKPKQANK